MDTRIPAREAIKRYRPSSKKVKYITASLTLDERLISFLDNQVLMESDKNMSSLIEEICSKQLASFDGDMETRRKYASFPKKKTFTFSEAFIKKTKKFGNVSLAIETMLSRHYKIEFTV